MSSFCCVRALDVGVPLSLGLGGSSVSDVSLGCGVSVGLVVPLGAEGGGGVVEGGVLGVDE